MVLTITILDTKKDLIVKVLTSIYGRDVDAQSVPTQTDEAYIIWAFKNFLVTSIREIKKKEYGKALDSESIIL